MGARKDIDMGTQDASRREPPRESMRESTVTPIDHHLGQRIRELRMARGMEEAELATGLGISVAAVGGIEGGAQRLAAARLLQIANLLEVKLVQLFEGSPRAALARGAETGDVAGHREMLDFFQACLRLEDADFKERLAQALAIAAEPD
jgi:transcriptional regulator with XRE-family HTH domain